MMQTTLAAATALFLAALAAPATAQSSSLGFNFATLTLEGDGDDLQSARGQLDILVTGHHGLQLDLGLSSYADQDIGDVAGHLYMIPEEGQKFGAFLSYHDLNDHALSYTSLGLEGAFALGADTVLDGRLGYGRMEGHALDYIFAGLGLSQALGEQLSLSARLNVTDIEQTGFAGQGISAELSARYALPSAPVLLELGLRHDTLRGVAGDPASTTAFAGITIELGSPAGARRPLGRRAFHADDPLQAFWRHDAIAF